MSMYKTALASMSVPFNGMVPGQAADDAGRAVGRLNPVQRQVMNGISSLMSPGASGALSGVAGYLGRIMPRAQYAQGSI